MGIREFIRLRWLVILITLAATVFAVCAAKRAERYFSSTGFCVKCHTMSFPYEAAKGGVHYGRLGINPECGDCHMPPEFHRRLFVHAYEGIKDTVSEFRLKIRTREDYERHKEEFSEKARALIKSWGSSPCRACHKSPRPQSASGEAAHKKLSEGLATCVDCHTGIFHP